MYYIGGAFGFVRATLIRAKASAASLAQIITAACGTQTDSLMVTSACAATQTTTATVTNTRRNDPGTGNHKSVIIAAGFIVAVVVYMFNGIFHLLHSASGKFNVVNGTFYLLNGTSGNFNVLNGTFYTPSVTQEMSMSSTAPITC